MSAGRSFPGLLPRSRLWLAGALALCFALSAATCETKGDIITDTGKARAMRERAEREARLKAEQEAARASGVDAGGAAVDGAQTSSAEDTTPVATPSTSPAVLLDVVRASSADPANPEHYSPVSDAELALVQVQRGGANVELQRGMALALGDEVITGAGVVALLSYEPNIEIYVMPQTHIRIGSIFVKLGEIWVSIKEALQEKFKVETEFVTAGVEGTEFLLRAAQDGTVDVNVVRGAVLCSSKQQRWQPVRMREREKFAARAERVLEKRAMLPAELASVDVRVRPLSVAKVKLPLRQTIAVDKQIYTGPLRQTPVPATRAPVKPEGAITKPPAAQPGPLDAVKPPRSSLPVKPTAPEGVVVKPPVVSTPPASAPITVKPPVQSAPVKTDVIVKPPTVTRPPSGSVLQPPLKPPSTSTQIKALPQ